MSNVYLRPLFKRIFGRDIEPKNPIDRFLVQAMIFLCQILGVPGNNYKFILTKKGVISHALSVDITSALTTGEHHPMFSDYVLKCFEVICEVLSQTPEGCTQQEWLDTVNSLIYLKDSVLPSDVTTEGIYKALKEYRPTLCNTEVCSEALRVATIIVGH